MTTSSLLFKGWMLTNNHGSKERSRISTLIMVKKKDIQEVNSKYRGDKVWMQW